MDLFFRLFIYFTFNVSLLFPLTKAFNIHQENISSSRSTLSNNVAISMTSKQKMGTNSDEIIIFEEDFENGVNGWSLGSGWELTETNSKSPSHSMVSFNNVVNQNRTHDLLTQAYALPELGSSETMHFGFWINADMPDSDGNEDGFLEDYYTISIQDVASYAWHSSDVNVEDGNGFWCADEDVGGYLDSWLQYMDTPVILIGNNGSVEAKIYYAIENDDAPFDVQGSCTNGWDAANVRISVDGGATWELLEDDTFNPYHFNCGYGWIYNNEEYEEGGSLHHLAKGWSGDSNGWLDFSVDLSDYANQEIIIRFAFGSDPAYSTNDDDGLTGFQVDDIVISDESGSLYSNDGSDESAVIISGEVWVDQFYDYGSCAEDRPGCNGWAEYVPGLAFNGNVMMNISDFAEKTIQFRIKSKFDDDNDGGQGVGLFIDDFKIYKLSSGAYFAPWNLNAEAGNGEAALSWGDMNASGTADFSFDNNFFEIENNLYMADGNGWAGEWFDIIGPSLINSISIYSSPSNVADTLITIQSYGMFGTLFDTEPLFSMTADISVGWNDISLDNWEMDNPFVIAYQFNDSFGAAMDLSTVLDHALYRSNEGSWYFLSGGNFGIRANISYEGANVTYNIYQDGALAASGLSSNSHVVTGLMNNTTYEFTVSATYPDGEESDGSDAVIVTPFANTVHEEGYDDGSFESEFNAGSGNFSAVRFSASSSGEDIVRFGWYQAGSSGAFYIKVFEDNGGMPGDEVFSAVQASGNVDGWNTKDLSTEGLNALGAFWIGVKEFSSSKPFGLDTSSDSGNSYQRVGSSGDWTSVSGNLGYHVFLDCGDNCDDEECANAAGDVNGDEDWDVLDVVALTNCILASTCGSIENGCAGDMNNDEIWNIIDIVALVNCIMNADCG